MKASNTCEACFLIIGIFLAAVCVVAWIMYGISWICPVDRQAPHTTEHGCYYSSDSIQKRNIGFWMGIVTLPITCGICYYQCKKPEPLLIQDALMGVDNLSDGINDVDTWIG